MVMAPPCIFQRLTPNPTKIKLFKARCYRTLSLVSNWVRAIRVLFNASKTQFLQLSAGHNLPDSDLLFFNDTQLPVSSTLNTLNLSFTKNLKLGVPLCLHPFFSLSQMLALYRGLIYPCIEYGSPIWVGSTHTALYNRIESKAFSLINSPPLTDCLDFLSQ